MPEGTHTKALRAAVLGYDNRIAQLVKHECWYAPHTLPEDPPSGSSSTDTEDDESDADSSTSKAEDEASSPKDKAEEAGGSVSASKADKGDAAP